MYKPQYFQTYSPRVRVTVKDLETADVLYDLSDDLTSLSTNKAYGRCSGTWQLMLTWTSKMWKTSNGQDLYWQNELEPNMMVAIEIDAGNGAGYFPVMCGLIDRVSAVRQGGPVPQRAVKVSGRDMGKLLETHDVAFDIIRYNLTLTSQDGEVLNTQALSRIWDPGMSMGAPGYLIGRAFETVLSDITSFQKFLFTDYTADIWQQTQTSFMTAQGIPFWQFIKQMEHHPYSILTTDTNSKNVDYFEVVLEKMPYSNETGKVERDADRWHTIGDTEIVTEDLGVTDQERINLLSYQPNIYSLAKIFTYDVMMVHPDLTEISRNDIAINGLCPKVLKDVYIPPEMEDTQDADTSRTNAAIVTAKGMKEVLWNWYKDNHTYESGSVSIHLRPDIRVGNGLLVEQGSTGEYKEYMIEQVSHQCVFNPQPQFLTSLHLTRGQKATPANKEQAKPPQPVVKAIPTSATAAQAQTEFTA